jgi:hypothetical protein
MAFQEEASCWYSPLTFRGLDLGKTASTRIVHRRFGNTETAPAFSACS